jgi:hypothetical protein
VEVVVSVVDLLHDVAKDEYRERRKLQQEYQDAAAASRECRIQVDTWERRELNAKRRLRTIADEFKRRGWLLP